ncbi:hypothetical protein AWZ03_008667 [Drosophila navojoa]|uniref:Regulatory protein zeste n=1 Tax=Drosophila navojoa TaxID=7232 RepID=A0A484B878_DRONA|nr:hypothetical protein AWZ03_008667 [Drosophila navojoa]
MTSLTKVGGLLSPEDDEQTDDPLATVALDIHSGPIEIMQDLSTDSESFEETEMSPKKKRIRQNLPKKRTHKNREQSNILIEFMTKHQDIAKGHSKGERFVVDGKWRSLTDDLNAVGPPFKNVSSWKKVWSDWKISIKRKLLQIKNDKRVALSPAEESIAQLCGFDENVEIIHYRNSSRYPSDQNYISNVNFERRHSLSGASSCQSRTEDESLAKVCESYEIVNVESGEQSPTRFYQFEPTINVNEDNAEFKREHSSDSDDYLEDSHYTDGLENLRGAQNALMTRVADSIDAMRSTIAEQTNAMLQHFKRMEEIELKKLEILKCLKK